MQPLENILEHDNIQVKGKHSNHIVVLYVVGKQAFKNLQEHLRKAPKKVNSFWILSQIQNGEEKSIAYTKL